MNGYFKPLRRKIGVLTLVLACVFAGMWVRSKMIAEYIYFRMSPARVHVFTSYPSSLMWNCRGGVSPVAFYGQIFIGYDPRKHSFSDLKIDNEWAMCGFQSLSGLMDNGEPIAVWIIPYSLLVIPLTAISAWLLLSKPRAKPEAPITPASENAC